MIYWKNSSNVSFLVNTKEALRRASAERISSQNDNTSYLPDMTKKADTINDKDKLGENSIGLERAQFLERYKKEKNQIPKTDKKKPAEALNNRYEEKRLIEARANEPRRLNKLNSDRISSEKEIERGSNGPGISNPRSERIDKLVAERIAAQKKKFQNMYQEESYSSEYASSGNDIDSQVVRNNSNFNKKRQDSDVSKAKSMAREAARLEAQQQARDIESKRVASERAKYLERKKIFDEKAERRAQQVREVESKRIASQRARDLQRQEKSEKMERERARLEAQQQTRDIEARMARKRAQHTKEIESKRNKNLERKKIFDEKAERKANERARLLEAQQQARDIELKRIASERATDSERKRIFDEINAAKARLKAEKLAKDIENKNRENIERMSKNKDTCDFNDRELDRQRADYNDYDGQSSYQSQVEAAMRAATEKAERLIAEEEAKLAEEQKFALQKDVESLSSTGTDPEKIWAEKCEEERIMNEQKTLADTIIRDANASLNQAYKSRDTSEILRLNSVLAEAKLLLEEKDAELAIIAEEKNLAAELLAEILRMRGDETEE